LRRVLIFGNSGSGKSTLAKTLVESEHLSHLDLDVLAWLPTAPPQRAPLAESGEQMETFIAANKRWVIEGCYADLLEIASPHATDLIYLDLPVEQCVQNAKKRPWEPHKYHSKEAQDANLEMLIAWIRDYDCRQDCFSRSAHEHLYRLFTGSKIRHTSNYR
jgi:adenylate kinase family enzyme